MKKAFTFFAATLILASCKTSVTYDDPAYEPSGEARRLYVNIITSDFTRGTDTGTEAENRISSLHLAFYHGDDCVGVEAANLEDGRYVADVPSYPGQHPDKVIAYANLSTADVSNVNCSFNNLDRLRLQSLQTSGKGFVMTTASHYNDGAYYYTPISESDYAKGADPLPVRLERVAAKVTVANESPDLKPVVRNNGVTSEVRRLNLTIDRWGLTAVEKQSRMIKRVGDTGNLGSWWNDTQNGTVHWSQSASWELTQFPKAGDNLENASFPLLYPRYSDIINGFSNVVYQHESTRPSTDYQRENALASLVITGHYTFDGETSPRTFYNYGMGVYTDDEIWDVFVKDQNVIYRDVAGAKPTKEELQAVASIAKVPGKAASTVTLQLKANADIQAYLDSEGKALTATVTELNAALAASLGYAEKFVDGKCVFIVPIRHKRYDPDAETQTTGAYGIVRNHHYRLTIESIEGLGSGVASDNDIVVVSDFSASIPEYSVGLSVTVNQWDVLDQKVNIRND